MSVIETRFGGPARSLSSVSVYAISASPWTELGRKAMCQ